MTLPKTRKEAYKTGSKYYKTGKPCKHGHDSKRYTSSKGCYECVKLKWSVANDNKKKTTAKQLVRRTTKKKRLSI